MRRWRITPYSDIELLAFYESLSLVEKQVLLAGIGDYLSVWDPFESDSKFFTLLQHGLWQLRLGPTARNVSKELPLQRILLRMYFYLPTEEFLVLVAFYNKGKDLRRETQKHLIELAYQRMGIAS